MGSKDTYRFPSLSRTVVSIVSLIRIGAQGTCASMGDSDAPFALSNRDLGATYHSARFRSQHSYSQTTSTLRDSSV